VTGPTLATISILAAMSATTTNEIYGWLAAIGGMLAFGSFGVPIKSKVATSLDIDPLVMQSYKTTMCFLTSWLFVLLRGEKYTFTPWGIVSGLFWVPAGIATIYAIKTAGLAIGIGVGSSCIVLVSFTWGIFGFQEHVHNRVQACCAVGCMLLGLCGMAYFSSPSVAHGSITPTSVTSSSDGAYYQPARPEDPDFLRPDEDEDVAIFVPSSVTTEPSCVTDYVAMDDKDDRFARIVTEPSTNNNELQEGDMNSVVEGNFRREEQNEVISVRCFGMMHVQERTRGILAALVFTGIWGGSILVPMHYAPPVDKGLGYLISFAIGAALVNLSLWLLRYIHLSCRYSSMKRGYQALPSFHVRKMWLYGGICGLLWSIGNFCSILAVEFLGEGVGYSATQAALLVSGLWGIHYFHEIEGAGTIAKWYGSAMLTVVGILLLSYEHHEK
jgi:glucose uptake protein GlcU